MALSWSGQRGKSDVIAQSATAGLALPDTHESGRIRRPDLDRSLHWAMGIAISGVLGAAILYVVYSIYADVNATGSPAASLAPYIAIFAALLLALTFEFVNGFHDTANAVATVIYTRSLPPHLAVVWSGMANLLGGLLSSGAVAYAIIALLPVELILQVGSKAGIAMVFALLIAAIIWNLGTWYLGLPASSSHTLIGSIIGVGVASALINGRSRSAIRCFCRHFSGSRWRLYFCSR
jgi:PiT family inorganic phosphate transporter